jgi:hypothetical protein
VHSISTVFVNFAKALNHMESMYSFFCAVLSKRFSFFIYRVYQNSTTKLQERAPHIERGKKVYDNMVPEMHNYRVIRAHNLRSARRHALFAGIKMRDISYNCYTSNHVANQFDVGLNTSRTRWIGTGGPIGWPPRSPDLNPLDFSCGDT